MATEPAEVPGDASPGVAPTDPPVSAAARRRLPAWLRWLGLASVALAGMLALALVVLESPIGHRIVADRIAHYAPASGLRVKVGRIEGSLLGAMTLRDVRFTDPEGLFLRVPVIELDWRPLNWFAAGLDVRRIVLRRGLLSRSPQLRSGDPDAPILPDFDVRIDRFELDRLTVAKTLAGTERRVDLVARARIRNGRALLTTDARLGGADRLAFTLDSAPKANRFIARLDYNAPRGGLLAGLIGARDGLTVKVDGRGHYTDWRGRAVATLSQAAGASANLAALELANAGGRYRLSGTLHPAPLLDGAMARAAGDTVRLQGEGTLAARRLSGQFMADGRGARLMAQGGVDLAANAFQALHITAQSRDPGLLGPAVRLDDARLDATLDGPFRRFAVAHRLTVARLQAGSFSVVDLRQQGRLTRDGERWVLPLDLQSGRIVTGNAMLDPRLSHGHAQGRLILSGTRLMSDGLVVGAPGLGGALALSGDLARQDYRLTGPVAARDVALTNLGLADADIRLDARFGRGPWLVDAGVAGRMTRVTNATLTTLAGTGLRFAGGVRIGQAQPLLFNRFTLHGSHLALSLDGRNLPNGTTVLQGRGQHDRYGRFVFDASVADDGPRAVLVLANPLPAAGLRDVRVALAPAGQGFRIETEGQSTFGPFKGTLGLVSPPGAPTRVDVLAMNVWQTAITGALTFEPAGISGALALTGGGVDGTLRLAPRTVAQGGGQGVSVALTAENARFGGTTPLAIGLARLTGEATLVDDHTTISANAYLEGIQYGGLFIGRLALTTSLADGAGKVTASLSGRRGGRFDLQLAGDVQPGQYSLLAQGSYAGQRIGMPRRAVLTRQGERWELAPTQIDFAGGRLIASGAIDGETRLDLAMADMPLGVIDIFSADLGLGGKASGTIAWRAPASGPPTADARLEVQGLTRSGLVLASRPLDLSLVARLSPSSLEARALLREGANVRGRVQGKIDGLPVAGSLAERLGAGALFAQVRYSGAADALWRLAALETFDLNGPVDLAADISGRLADPVINGSLASTGLRLQSAVTGTDLQNVAVRGTFAGSRLQLTQFLGHARGGGTVAGSGMVDLSGLGAGRGPGLDLRLAARDAELIARDDMAATVSGPLRIVSDGQGGTIAGRLTIASARWALGKAAAEAELPVVNTREINPRADIAPARAPSAPWTYLIDARGGSRIAVRGLGLDSEWGADIRLRGTTQAPAISGEAKLVRGGYDFAGKRFELTKGAIHFDGNSPPDPRLDITATADITGLTASVTVQGTASKPEIRFTSVPSLPEEELLSRLLFGSSITQMSAPEAVQIGAALAALRGGGGLDPINRLRSAIGLDRLRIVGADAANGRGTSVAVGKNIGRHFYAEIVTDGRGYNATQLEFRVTRWLSLLASVSSLGRQGLDAKVSKDY